MKSMHIYRDTPVTQGVALSRKDRCRLTAEHMCVEAFDVIYKRT